MEMQSTVLIVDDDPGIRRTVSRILELEGYRVLTAAGGPEALGVAGREGFDIGLVDFKMGDMDGGDVCAALRRVDPGAPLYLVTAHVDPESERAALGTGASGILHKPVDVRQLLELIASITRRERDVVELAGGT